MLDGALAGERTCSVVVADSPGASENDVFTSDTVQPSGRLCGGAAFNRNVEAVQALLFRLVKVTVYCSSRPAAPAGDDSGATTTPGAASVHWLILLTVSSVPPPTPPRVADILAVPSASVLAKPVASIVATL